MLGNLIKLVIIVALLVLLINRLYLAQCGFGMDHRTGQVGSDCNLRLYYRRIF